MNINTTHLAAEGFKVQSAQHPELSEVLTLVTPTDMGTKWHDGNARFRSALLNSSGSVVSQGFGKFTNYGEKPEFQPWDPTWPVEARHKMDGSLLIVSQYAGVVLARTRGTADARNLSNGHEINMLREKYPTAFSNVYLDSGWTLLFEWTTPNNIIVIREHAEPTLTLLGLVDNETAVLMTPSNVDAIATILGLPRPDRYVYDSIASCIADVSAWVGKEGVVLYSPDGQTLKKIKADAYLKLHRLATGIKNIKHVLELFICSPRFTVADEFYAYVESTLDYEVAEKIKDDIETVVAVYNDYLQLVDRIKSFIKTDLDWCETRKDVAIRITGTFAPWQTGLAFSLFDRKEINEKQFSDTLFKILEQYGN
jgi:hypothetical protein